MVLPVAGINQTVIHIEGFIGFLNDLNGKWAVLLGYSGLRWFAAAARKG